MLRNTARSPSAVARQSRAAHSGVGRTPGLERLAGTALPDALGRWTADLSTGTGETRESLLSDGSQVWLNALSALNVRFDTTQRLLLLRPGKC